MGLFKKKTVTTVTSDAITKVEKPNMLSNFYNVLLRNKKIKQVDIDNFQKRLTSSNVADFRNGLQRTKDKVKPLFYLLQEQYEEIYRDIEVNSAYSLLINNIVSRSFEIEGNEKLTESLQESVWFKDMIRIIIESTIFGYSVLTIDEINDDVEEVGNYERELYNPISKQLLQNKYSYDSGVNIESPEYKDWYIEIIGDKKFEGEMSNVAIMAIYLKDMTISWVDLLNRFSAPQPIAKTANNDDTYLAELQEYLSQIQAGSYAVLDENTEFEMVEPKSLNADTFEKLKDYLISQIRKQILGTEKLGGDSQWVGSAEISKQLFNTKVTQIIDFVEDILNNKVFESLVALGLNQYSNAKIKIDKTFEMSKNDRLSTVTELIKAGVPVNLEWISEQFDIEIDKNMINKDESNDK